VGRAKPLREVSYWPRNSIKRSNIEGPLRTFLVHRRSASPEIVTFPSTAPPNILQSVTFVLADSREVRIAAQRHFKRIANERRDFSRRLLARLREFPRSRGALVASKVPSSRGLRKEERNREGK